MRKRNFDLQWRKPSIQLLAVLVALFAFSSASAHDEAPKDATELLLARINAINNSADCKDGDKPLPQLNSLNPEFCERMQTAPQRFCEPVWPQGKKPWERERTKQVAQSYASTERKSPSYNDQLKQGLKLISEQEEKNFLAEARATQKNMESACCGNDRECLKAFRKVKISFCSSAKAQQNPNEPDPCALYGGVYNISESDGFQQLETNSITKAAALALPTSKYSNNPYLSGSQKEMITRLYNSIDIKGYRADSSFVQSANIVFNSYSYDNKPIATSLTINHELAHACSYIKRQVLMNSTQDPVLAGKVGADLLWYRYNGEDQCKVSDETQSIYTKVAENLDSGARVVSCLRRLSEDTANPASANYFEGSCPRRKFEEGFAEAMALLTATAPSSAALMYQCQSLPSTAHPSSSEVIGCALENSNLFKQKVSTAFQCQ